MRLSARTTLLQNIKGRENLGDGTFIGLPDLEGRIELKPLINAKGIGAIGRHPHDTSDEKGLTPCVIGNSRGALTDEACEKAIIEKMGKRHVSDVLLIRSDGTCWRKRK